MTFYNNPAFAQAAANLARWFAPPDGSDAANWAAASAKQADTNRRGQVFDYATDPNFNLERFDRMGVGANLYAPSQSYYAVNKDDATKRYGYDRTYQASTENNVRDNQRAAIGTLFQPLNPGQVRPEVGPEFMDTLQLPSAPAVSGAPKPQTEDELKAAIFAGLPDEQKKAIVFGNTPVENVVTSEGPRISTRMDAVGKEPYIIRGADAATKTAN